VTLTVSATNTALIAEHTEGIGENKRPRWDLTITLGAVVTKVVEGRVDIFQTRATA